MEPVLRWMVLPFGIALLISVWLTGGQQAQAQAVLNTITCALASAPFQQGSVTWDNWTCSDGRNYQVQENPADANWYADEAAVLIALANEQDNLAGSVPTPGQPVTPTPPVTIVPPVPPVVVPPPAAVTQFQADYSLARDCQRAIAYGLIPSTDQTCTADIAQAVKDFTANETLLLPFVQ